MFCEACGESMVIGQASLGRRGWCKPCYAAKMAGYMRQRRRLYREADMLSRARERARTAELEFALELADIHVPERCPVRSVALAWGFGRNPDVPSLDRIDANRGYTPDNVRVISDEANRWKGDLTLKQLARRASRAGPDTKFPLLHSYVVRALRTEELIVQLHRKLGPAGADQAMNVARFLRRKEVGKLHPKAESWKERDLGMSTAEASIS